MQQHTTPAPVLLTVLNGVATVTFNRPEQLNTLDIGVAEAFLDICQQLDRDPAVRVVVLRGAGRGFGAGGDLAAFTGDAPAAARAIIGPLNEAVLLLTGMDAPVIASLHGMVAGGSLSLACACDLAIAAEDTRFNLAYIHVAATCDVSGSWHLPRLVGLRQAMAMALLGETLNAQQALHHGLVNRVVPTTELEHETTTLAQRLAAGPALSLARNKRLLRHGLNHDLATHLECERLTFETNAGTADFREGISAFLQKRKPAFHGA